MNYLDLVAAIFYGRPGESFQCYGFDTDLVIDPPQILWCGVDADGAATTAPTLADIEGWDTERKAQNAAQALGTAWVQLRMIRDRWLTQTDYVESFISDAASFAHLPQAVKDAITTNSAEWVEWRQLMRDLPTQDGLDVIAVVPTMPHASNQTPWPAGWPPPPTAPVIHFT